MQQNNTELIDCVQSLLAIPQGKTSNFADYTTCAPYVCCGWLDFHDDSDNGATAASPYFTIKPIYWDAQAALVVTNECGKFEVIPRQDGAVRILATKDHAVVPHEVAEEVIQLQSTKGPLCTKFEWELANEMVPPKMVWAWLTER